MQNRALIAKAARRACALPVAPSARTTRALLRSEYEKVRIRKGYPEYDDNQARGEDGKWTAGGGGASGGGASRPKEPRTPRDWSRVAAVATDVALIAGAIALTGPGGATAMAGAVGARAVASLARTSVGRTAMNAVGALAASRAWQVAVEPVLRHVGKAYGLLGLDAALRAYKAMGGQVPSGATLSRLAAKFGISAAGKRLAGHGQQIARAVRQAVEAARRALQGARAASSRTAFAFA